MCSLRPLLYAPAAVSQPTPPTVTVVIPMHNEAEYAPVALPKLFAQLEAVDADVAVLAVENGSTDGTADTIRALADRFPALDVMELPEPDYGAAMRTGFLAAGSDWVVNFDIDYFSGDFLTTALGHAGTADLILGSKRAPGSSDERSMFRRFATWGFNLLLRFVLGSKVSDTHGMKAIHKRVIEAVGRDVVSTTDLFDTELVIRAERAGFVIVEVPVVVREERESKSRLWKRIPRTLRGIWRIRRMLAAGETAGRSRPV